MPSCDQIGVPLHFHSSMTSGSASLMNLRILLRVFPRQSPRSAILFEMSARPSAPIRIAVLRGGSWRFASPREYSKQGQSSVDRKEGMPLAQKLGHRRSQISEYVNGGVVFRELDMAAGASEWQATRVATIITSLPGVLLPTFGSGILPSQPSSAGVCK